MACKRKKNGGVYLGQLRSSKRPVGTGDGSELVVRRKGHVRQDDGKSRIRVKGKRPTSYGSETSPFVSIKINGKVLFVRRKGN